MQVSTNSKSKSSECMILLNMVYNKDGRVSYLGDIFLDQNKLYFIAYTQYFNGANPEDVHKTVEKERKLTWGLSFEDHIKARTCIISLSRDEITSIQPNFGCIVSTASKQYFFGYAFDYKENINSKKINAWFNNQAYYDQDIIGEGMEITFKPPKKLLDGWLNNNGIFKNDALDDMANDPEYMSHLWDVFLLYKKKKQLRILEIIKSSSPAFKAAFSIHINNSFEKINNLPYSALIYLSIGVVLLSLPIYCIILSKFSQQQSMSNTVAILAFVLLCVGLPLVLVKYIELKKWLKKKKKYQLFFDILG